MGKTDNPPDVPECAAAGRQPASAHCRSHWLDVNYKSNLNGVTMLRPWISSLVIMGFVASQLAAAPHAHRGISQEEQQQHDATPHFHYSWVCHDHSEHGHSHGGDSHQHDRPSEPG